MLVTWALLAVFFMPGQTPPSLSPAKDAERELRKSGVIFRKSSLYTLILEEPKTPEEAKRLGRNNIHVVIQDSQKLGRANLKHLRDLPPSSRSAHPQGNRG